jgi:hypothetical protein
MTTPGHEITVVYVSVERELEALGQVAAILERLDTSARFRVLAWACARNGATYAAGTLLRDYHDRGMAE